MEKEKMVRLIAKELHGELSPGAGMHMSVGDRGGNVTAETGARIIRCLDLLAERIDEIEAAMPSQAQ